MPPRRSHKKSRNGCKRCKSRKIKVRRNHMTTTTRRMTGLPCPLYSATKSIRPAAIASSMACPVTLRTAISWPSPRLRRLREATTIHVQ